MKILLVDDHAPVRRSLRDLIEIAGDHQVVGEAGSGREAIEKALDLTPDLILMDVNMPGMSGVEATREIKDRKPQVKILALTALGDMTHVSSMIKAGASGYLLKGGSSEQLISSIQAAGRGEGPLDKEVTIDVIKGLADLEMQLRQAQKMESIGQLVGGIAHDFNNLIAVIGNYAQFLYDELEGDEAKREDLSEIMGATERAASLVKQLLTFSRKEEPKPQLVDLNELVGSAAKLWGRALGEDIELRTELDDSLARVLMDPTQIEQILMNLIVNARDAMPTGGTLTIATANLKGPPKGAPAGGDTQRFVCLSVADSGSGMDAEVAARIFDPFFTTKPRDSGTGLGLATVHGIVKQSLGYLEVDTAPGQGTKFHVYLPVADGAPVVQPREEIRPERLTTRARVLVVEDEESVRRLVVRILESAGLDVNSAASAQEALDLLELGRNYDLLLTDVIMPGLSGKELAERVVARRPGIHTMFMSGYSDHVLSRYGLPHDAGLITKPFTVSELLDSVLRHLELPARG